MRAFIEALWLAEYTSTARSTAAPDMSEPEPEPAAAAELGQPPNMASPKPAAADAPKPAPSGGSRPGSLPIGTEEGLAKEVESWHGTGLEDLRGCLDPGRVMFGVIRFELGSGSFARSKYCFIHVVGESVGAMKRGKHNSRKEEIMEKMQGSHTDISFDSAEEVNLDTILTHMLSTIAADEGGSEGKVDMEAFRKQLEEQMAKAPEPEPEPEPEAGAEGDGRPRKRTAVDLGIDFGQALEHVRSQNGSLNWLLAEPDAAAPKIVNAGSGSIPEMRDFVSAA